MYSIFFRIAGLICYGAFCGSTSIYAQANAVARDPDFNYYVHSQERETPPKASSFLNTLTPSKKDEVPTPRRQNHAQMKKAADNAWAHYKAMKGKSAGNASSNIPDMKTVQRPIKPNAPTVQKTITNDMGGVAPHKADFQKRTTPNTNIADMLKRYREKQTNDAPLNTISITK